MFLLCKYLHIFLKQREESQIYVKQPTAHSPQELKDLKTAQKLKNSIQSSSSLPKRQFVPKIDACDAQKLLFYPICKKAS